MKDKTKTIVLLVIILTLIIVKPGLIFKLIMISAIATLGLSLLVFVIFISIVVYEMITEGL